MQQVYAIGVLDNLYYYVWAGRGDMKKKIKHASIIVVSECAGVCVCKELVFFLLPCPIFITKNATT